MAEQAEIIKPIRFKCQEELYLMICSRADRSGESLSDFVCRTMAKSLNVPQLGTVPKKNPGRKRK